MSEDYPRIDISVTACEHVAKSLREAFADTVSDIAYFDVSGQFVMAGLRGEALPDWQRIDSELRKLGFILYIFETASAPSVEILIFEIAPLQNGSEA